MQSNNIVQKPKTAEQLQEIIEKFEDKSECIGRLWAEEAGMHFMFYKDKKGRIQIEICKDEIPIVCATVQRHHAREISEMFRQIDKEYQNRNK